MMAVNPMNKLEEAGAYRLSDPSVINNISSRLSSYIRVHAKGSYYYYGVAWPILYIEKDYLPSIMKTIFNSVNQAYQISSRMFATRFDLHLKEYSDNNHVIAEFCRQLKASIRLTYPKSYFHILWVREQDKSLAQHYHCVVMMDGNHIRTSVKLNKMIKNAWKAVTKGLVWFPKNGYYHFHRNDIDKLTSLLLRLSYFAKCKSKSLIERHISLCGKKHYAPIKKRLSGKKSLKQCQTPAESCSPLPGEMDDLFHVDKPQHPRMKREQLTRVANGIHKKTHINRLIKLYERKQSTLGPILPPHWLRHFDCYYQKYWPCNVSVAQYAHWHFLNPATARRYLCNYSASLISPPVLRRFIQQVTE